MAGGAVLRLSDCGGVVGGERCCMLVAAVGRCQLFWSTAWTKITRWGV